MASRTRKSNRPPGYKTLFAVSLPLVLSMAATTVMEFTDRVFLANYAIDAIAAAIHSPRMRGDEPLNSLEVHDLACVFPASEGKRPFSVETRVDWLRGQYWKDNVWVTFDG
jgi:hypothetical protein